MLGNPLTLVGLSGRRTYAAFAVVLLAVAFLLTPVPPVHASGGLITCTASLTGANENPPNSSEGSGNGIFTFDPATNTTTYNVNFSLLLGTATASHIHSPAGPGVNAAVVVPLTGIPSATSGSFSGSTTTLIGRSTAQFVGDLLSGNAYVNIHSVVYPGGEIRSQLACSQQTTNGVPEFGFGAMAAAISLVCVALLARRGRPARPA